MDSRQIARVRSLNQALQSASPFPAPALPSAGVNADLRVQNHSGLDHDSDVKDWLKRARNAIPRYERDEKRAEWMYRRMEAFARRNGEQLSVLRRDGHSGAGFFDGAFYWCRSSASPA